MLFEIIRHLKAQGTAIVYISHILGDVIEQADDIAVLRDGAWLLPAPSQSFQSRR